MFLQAVSFLIKEKILRAFHLLFQNSRITSFICTCLSQATISLQASSTNNLTDYLQVLFCLQSLQIFRCIILHAFLCIILMHFLTHCGVQNSLTLCYSTFFLIEKFPYYIYNILKIMSFINSNIQFTYKTENYVSFFFLINHYHWYCKSKIRLS